jgi:uncharacterized caspase-like protein
MTNRGVLTILLLIAALTTLVAPADKEPSLAQLGTLHSAATASELTWQIETIDSGSNMGLYNSLALDSSDRPRISYYDATAGDLMYAYHDGSTWQKSAVDSTGDVGRYTSLALDSNEYPHISYSDWGNGHLKYAYYDGAWHPATIDSASDTGWYTSLALDSNDVPRVCSYRAGPCGTDAYCNLRCLRRNGSWVMDVHHYSTGTIGEYNSLMVDHDDHPHVSYYDRTNGWLRYLYHDGTAWQWGLSIADNASNVGTDTSLDVDTSGHPHIAYLRVIPNDNNLLYAYHDGTGWYTETVDAVGDVGRSASLALDSAGRPHISYYDLSNDTLKYARHTGSAWQIETVDSVGNVQGWEGTSLALDSADRPHISYYTTSGLKYAYGGRFVYLPLIGRNYPTRYAIVVGVADYENDWMPPPCFLADLPYPDDDARAIEQALLDVGGFEAGNVLTLIDSQATKAAIQDAITNWLASREGPGDLVVFYFAGHGGQLNGDYPPIGDEADGYDEYLIPYDWACDIGDTAIADDELDSWLDTLDSQHVVVLADCCYGGGIIAASSEGSASCKSRCLPPPADLDWGAVVGDGLPQDINRSGRLVLTASREDEESYECDSLQSGVFSYYLRQALRATVADIHDGNGWVSGEEAYDYLRPLVESEMCYQPWFQHPQMSDGIPGEEDLTQP